MHYKVRDFPRSFFEPRRPFIYKQRFLRIFENLLLRPVTRLRSLCSSPLKLNWRAKRYFKIFVHFQTFKYESIHFTILFNSLLIEWLLIAFHVAKFKKKSQNSYFNALEALNPKLKFLKLLKTVIIRTFEWNFSSFPQNFR